MLTKNLLFIILLFTGSFHLPAQSGARLYAMNSLKGRGSDSIAPFQVRVQLDTLSTSLIVRVINPPQTIVTP